MPRVQNLLTYSEQFDNAAWTKLLTTVSENTADTLDPLGGNTADKWTDSVDAGPLTHRMQSATETTKTQGSTYTASIYAKAGTKSIISVSFDNGTGCIYFNLSTSVTTVSLATNVISYGMISVGNGWYRCWVTYTPGVASNSWFYWGATANYQGDGTGTIYAWGAQDAMCAGLPEYVQTTSAAVDTGPVRYIVPTRQNLLTYSESLDNAIWTKQNTTVLANQAANPHDGLTTADLVYPTTSGALRSIYQAVAVSMSKESTVSVYAKAAGLNFIALTDPAGVTYRAWFNLATGAVGTVAAGVQASIVSLGNGWYRCSMVWPAAASAAGWVVVGVCDADNSTTATTSGTNGVLVFGGQMVLGTYKGDYQVTTSAPYNIGPMRSLAQQPQNLLQQSEAFSHANWIKDAGTVVTADQIANPVSGAVDADLIDITATAYLSGIYGFSPNAAPAALLDHVYRGFWICRSVWLKGFVGGEIVRLEAPANVTGLYTTCTLTTSWARYVHIEQASDNYAIASTDINGIWLRKVSGNKFYAWGAQFTKTNYPTDYVKTTTAMVNPARGTR